MNFISAKEIITQRNTIPQSCLKLKRKLQKGQKINLDSALLLVTN